MVHLIALLEAAQDGHRVGHGRLLDQHGLEAALEGRVLLDVLAVLVEGGGADHAQLASGQHRLEDVAGVHGAVTAGACADDGVELVDEGDDLAVGLLDLVEHRLEALLELAAELGAGDHGREIECDETLVLQALGHVALGDTSGETLGDGGLADAGLTDEHRVVLGPTGQDLDGAPDLVVAPDDGIETTVTGGLGEVRAELLERLEGRLWFLRGDAVRPAHLAQRVEHVGSVDVEPCRLVTAARAGHGDDEVLGRQVLVAELDTGLVGVFEDAPEPTGDLGIAAAVAARQRVERLVGPVAQGQRCQTETGDEGEDDTFGLLEERPQQVVGGDFGVRGLACGSDRRRHGLVGLQRPAVRVSCHDVIITPDSANLIVLLSGFRCLRV